MRATWTLAFLNETYIRDFRPWMLDYGEKVDISYLRLFLILYIRIIIVRSKLKSKYSVLSFLIVKHYFKGVRR